MFFAALAGDMLAEVLVTFLIITFFPYRIWHCPVVLYLEGYPVPHS